ncbi:hypothetical protein EDD16DRAFT_1699724 [Pisolithus croceorrhizus]|nr:hypothetical protein EV401DRAFT_2065303 [Pisolithus croceorrhizus]KAI6132582.1 hypothetical protein EDD16DRAFT_1699724 [Pisolithus croceorrhizus]KAI6139853.1 hypothetical protein EDD17DRAFT_1770394 [Pisolithus thermaeus]
MDSGKLSNYRSLYFFRFHPYARVGPSARERTMATLYNSNDNSLLSDEHGPSRQTAVPGSIPPNIIARDLDGAVNVIHSVGMLRRPPSMSTLVVDLALLVYRKPPPTP